MLRAHWQGALKTVVDSAGNGRKGKRALDNDGIAAGDLGEEKVDRACFEAFSKKIKPLTSFPPSMAGGRFSSNTSLMWGGKLTPASGRDPRGAHIRQETLFL